MTAEPLTPKNALIVVACAHANQAIDERAKYGEDVVDQVSMHVCTTVTQAEEAKSQHPADTPWTIMAGASPFVIQSLQAFFGPPRSFAYAVEAQNNEYAIHHRILTRSGA